MKKILFLSILFIALSVTSCTENQRAKVYGGTANIDLPKNQKLVNVTWKDEELWYLTRPMKQDEVVETYSFNEKSGFGLIEGTVIITENK